jgi:hypothetical protein
MVIFADRMSGLHRAGAGAVGADRHCSPNKAATCVSGPEGVAVGPDGTVYAPLPRF